MKMLVEKTLRVISRSLGIATPEDLDRRYASQHAQGAQPSSFPEAKIRRPA
jgi:hypothetical protein